MVESVSTAPMGEAVQSVHGLRSILLRQHEQGSWTSLEHFREAEPKEPLGAILLITPCGSINKDCLLKYLVLLTKGILRMSSSCHLVNWAKWQGK